MQKISVTKKIKVLRIVTRMNLGGPAIQIANLVNGIDEKRFDHYLVVGKCNKDEIEYVFQSPENFKMSKINSLSKNLNLKNDIFSTYQLIRLIRKYKPDIVHTHMSKAGVLGRIASIIAYRKSYRIHTYHGHVLNGYFPKYVVRIIILIEKFLAKFTDKLLVVGKSVAEELYDFGISHLDHFMIMKPGVNFDYSIFYTNISKAQSNLVKCAFIGRLTKIKRLDRYLDVVKELTIINPQIEFLLIGDGELMNYCVARIHNENLPVKICGWQLNIELILSEVDIVILTSDNEGMPLALIQAGMAGLPVVTTNVGSVSEIVINDKTGFVVQKSVREISKAIQILAQNRNLRIRMGLSAREYVNTEFSVQKLVDNHENLYSELFSK
jgi:glycosyltransferase involved in cell wall biosynthesis